ncbi:hypothetical protein D9M71_641770 [compost metagenome]
MATLVHSVQLAEQIEAVGHQVAAIELVLGVVKGRRAQEVLVLMLHAPRGVVADGVVDADFPVVTLQVKQHRSGILRNGQCE